MRAAITRIINVSHFCVALMCVALCNLREHLGPGGLRRQVRSAQIVHGESNFFKMCISRDETLSTRSFAERETSKVWLGLLRANNSFLNPVLMSCCTRTQQL